VPDISRYGAVRRDAAGRILAWNEKLEDGGQPLAGEINGGIYVMKKSLIAEIPEGKQSLEQDCIPKWLSEGKRIFGLPFDGYFMDIGIPKDYQQFITDVEQGKHGK